jgi:hypothetical protein
MASRVKREPHYSDGVPRARRREANMGSGGIFTKAFAGGFIGKLAAATFIAICLALGIGPDKWAKFIVTGLPPWVTPEHARMGFLILAALTFIAITWPILTRWRVRRSGISQQLDMKISAAESGHLIPASPATAPIVQNMTLRSQQKKQLIKSVIALKPAIKSIMINRSSRTRNNLWIEFAEVFNRAGFGGVDGGGVQTGFQESTTPDETGVMICINDPTSPSKIDAIMKDALEDIGIESKYIPLSEALYKGDITIFVGPDPL